jgi:hypothetical protein
VSGTARGSGTTSSAPRFAVSRRGNENGMSDTTVAWWVVIGLGGVAWFACCVWVVCRWRRQSRRATEARRPSVVDTCEGCLAQGSHRRWCPAVVGRPALYLGVLSQDAETLADQIGSDEVDAANACYLAALLLRDRAIVLANEFQGQRIE